MVNGIVVSTMKTHAAKRITAKCLNFMLDAVADLMPVSSNGILATTILPPAAKVWFARAMDG